MAAILRFQRRTLIVADNPLENLLSRADKASKSHVPVLLSGESGTGKELIARYIHEKSRFAQGPFVSVNCAAVPEGLLESEFFGYERGAFTGAITRKIGKFEMAGDGTLLLDEISEMPIALQAKLLRVLQEGEIDRLGGTESIPIKCRIISTSNKDPIQLIREGKFREDLYFRLNVFRIDCPPLRERKEAIVSLAHEFVRQACEEHGMPTLALTEGAVHKLLAHSWPGNIRELHNAVERAVLLADGTVLEEDCFEGLQAIREVPKIRVSLADVELDHIQQVLEQTAGNREKAAKKLGITSRTLRNKLREME